MDLGQPRRVGVELDRQLRRATTESVCCRCSTSGRLVSTAIAMIGESSTRLTCRSSLSLVMRLTSSRSSMSRVI